MALFRSRTRKSSATDTIGSGQGTVYSFSVVARVVPTPSSLTNGEVGVAYSQSISASGGSGTITLAASNVTNTTGLSIGGTTISGTPTSTGAVSFTVTPTDAVGTAPPVTAVSTSQTCDMMQLWRPARPRM